jgi:hypothetical protein
MKRVGLQAFFLGVCLVLAAGLAHSQPVTLDTPTYRIRIESSCAEGSVTCRKVKYIGTNKRTGRSVTIVGHTVPASCRDEQPCSFQAYEFVRGEYGYYVTKDGTLVVSKGNANLLREQGVWQ